MLPISPDNLLHSGLQDVEFQKADCDIFYKMFEEKK